MGRIRYLLVLSLALLSFQAMGADSSALQQAHIDHRKAVSYTHLRAHETDSYLVCRLLLEKKK